MRDTSAQSLGAAINREKAVYLILDGYNQRQIGEKLGVSQPQVNKYLKKAFKDYNRGINAKIPALRARELARFDRLAKRLIPLFEDVDVKDEKTGEVTKKPNPKFQWAWERDLTLGKQRREMLGLDAASKFEVTGHNAGPVKVRHDIQGMEDLDLRSAMAELLKGG